MLTEVDRLWDVGWRVRQLKITRSWARHGMKSQSKLLDICRQTYWLEWPAMERQVEENGAVSVYI